MTDEFSNAAAYVARHPDRFTKEPAMPEPAVNPKDLRAVADGKDPLDYLEPLVNGQVARAMKHGADKYGYRNYTLAPCSMRTYIGAARRHLDALALGEDIDPDSGLSHWAHVIAGATCYFACELTGIAVDDRAPAATPLSDRVHVDGDLDAKGLTPEYNRGIDELGEEFAADVRRAPCTGTNYCRVSCAQRGGHANTAGCVRAVELDRASGLCV